MAKRIQCSPEDIEEIIAQVRKQLETAKTTQGTYTVNFARPDNRKINLRITETAWAKMTALVADFDGEVGWHGLVRRAAPDLFEVYDVLVYPHEVTSATITADQAKYEAWLDGLDDETFAALRFHGHSHVNFGVSPSGTDDEVRRKKLGEFPRNSTEDQFYIFMIINKKWEWSATVYDISDNSLYETGDINLEIQMGDTTMAKFLAEAKQLATKRTYTPTQYNYSGNYGYSGYSGYQSKGYGGYDYYDDDFHYKDTYNKPAANSYKKDAAKDTSKGNTQFATKYWNGNDYLEKNIG